MLESCLFLHSCTIFLYHFLLLIFLFSFPPSSLCSLLLFFICILSRFADVRIVGYISRLIFPSLVTHISSLSFLISYRSLFFSCFLPLFSSSFSCFLSFALSRLADVRILGYTGSVFFLSQVAHSLSYHFLFFLPVLLAPSPRPCYRTHTHNNSRTSQRPALQPLRVVFISIISTSSYTFHTSSASCSFFFTFPYTVTHLLVFLHLSAHIYKGNLLFVSCPPHMCLV